MARFNYEDADNYGGNGGHGFFSLKDDGDIARVRFMYNGIDDVEGYACHEVDVDGKKRYVNCLREYNEPIANCPFCAAKRFQVAKLYIPVYDIEADQVKLWERGKKFFAKISSICNRYSDLVSHTFEIERHGKKGDTSTQYEIYETGQDDTTLEDLPEIPSILGGIILDKSANDMEYYLENDCFPAENGNGGNVSRRSSSRDDSRRSSSRDDSPREDRGFSRRTPASRNRSDEF